jgi:site-specific DNA recombinase
MSRAIPRLRCAIYTRKSSEEGLEQDFNSLDAQREACAAYVTSQIGEGWSLIETRYDDGGFSGGSLERPALHRLLRDIELGKIDIVVVYKVDRLTRSLADFARIVETFDSQKVSFCSITQAFNTTTSMGRLTLNVLLSFAQFEREVTGERIRDKIAASKAKGMWMGGTPMLGYMPTGRTLTVDEAEAETVRFIFRRYVELKSIHVLAHDLMERGIKSKQWVTLRGKPAGGYVLGRGALLHLLCNRTYLGEIPHKGRFYAGQHKPIIDQALFDAVQAQLQDNRVVRGERPLRPGGSPLTGLVFDDRGAPMSPSQSRGRSKTTHRYYVSSSLIRGKRKEAGSLARVPADALEKLVLKTIAAAFNNPPVEWSAVRGMIERVIVSANEIRVAFSDATAEAAGIPTRTINVPIRLGRRGGAACFLDADGRPIAETETIDPALVDAMARAWRWRTLLASGAFARNSDLAKAEGVTLSTVNRVTRFAYLAPDIIRDILDGRQRPGLTLDQLSRMTLPLDWESQRRLIGRVN